MSRVVRRPSTTTPRKRACASRFASSPTLIRLAKQPGTGGRHAADHPILGELRFAPVSSRFKSMLIFYLPHEEGIEVVRVSHAARDLPRIPADEFGLDEGPSDE